MRNTKKIKIIDRNPSKHGKKNIPSDTHIKRLREVCHKNINKWNR